MRWGYMASGIKVVSVRCSLMKSSGAPPALQNLSGSTIVRSLNQRSNLSTAPYTDDSAHDLLGSLQKLEGNWERQDYLQALKALHSFFPTCDIPVPMEILRQKPTALSYLMNPKGSLYDWKSKYTCLREKSELESWLLEHPLYQICDTTADLVSENKSTSRLHPIFQACQKSSVRSRISLCLIYDMLVNEIVPGNYAFSSCFECLKYESELSAMLLLLDAMEATVPPHPGIMAEWSPGLLNFGWENPSQEHFNMTLSTAAVLEDIKAALKLIKRMREREIHSTSSYNMLIEAYGRSNKPLDSTFVLMSTMEANAIEPDEKSYENAIRSTVLYEHPSVDVSSRVSKWIDKEIGDKPFKSAISLFELAKNNEILISRESYLFCLYGCQRNNQWTEATILMFQLLEDEDLILTSSECNEFMALYLEFLRESNHDAAMKDILKFVRKCKAIGERREKHTCHGEEKAHHFVEYCKRFGLLPPLNVSSRNDRTI